MTGRVYAAAIEHNTILDRTMPVTELEALARGDDELFVTPVSGDALTKVRKLGRAHALAQLRGWRV